MTKKIMVVDDSVSMRCMLSITLRTAGYEVIEAADGSEALAKMEGESFNLILTDLNMPNMDGLSLTRAVKRHPRHRFVPVVILSTDSERELKDAGRAAGVRAWACKPFQPETLLSTISRLVLA